MKSPTNSENPYSNLPVTGRISSVTYRPFNLVGGFSSVFKIKVVADLGPQKRVPGNILIVIKLPHRNLPKACI